MHRWFIHAPVQAGVTLVLPKDLHGLTLLPFSCAGQADLHRLTLLPFSCAGQAWTYTDLLYFHSPVQVKLGLTQTYFTLLPFSCAGQAWRPWAWPSLLVRDVRGALQGAL